MSSIIAADTASEQVDAPLRPYPSKLFVETTTRCNLSCFMCVKQSDDRCIEEGDLSAETFARILPALPRARALILNGVGEPLLHPLLESFIRQARAMMPADGWVGFQSNGLLLDEKRAFSLLEAGLDRICLSVDTITPEVFRQLRAGGELTSIDKALQHLETAKRTLGKPDFRIGVEFVVMRDNFRELPAAIHWAAARGASFALVTHVLPYDQNHMEQALYSLCSEKSLNLYLKGKELAERNGVDISSYDRQLAMKFTKTAQDRKILEYVDKLKAEAEQAGIFLDLKKLNALDLEMLAQVAAIFEQTAAIAAGYGLELKLPQITLNDERKCEFVEEGSLFVSWNGDVHPCYFLWHAYRCFASGWSQDIQPRIFGNLQHQEILKIWNSPQFTTFRGNVIPYDYPFCSNCGLAPCDYVQTEAFEHDCHIKEEPCGSCFWCMGIFRCLS